MRLSEAKSNAKPLVVEFDGGASLNITYRVPEYTPNQAAKLTDEAGKDPRRMAEMACRIVDSWDLERDDGEPIPLVPDVVAEEVHLGILTKIMRAVNADQMPGEAGATSDAG